MDIIEKISKFFAEQEQTIQQSLPDAAVSKKSTLTVPSRPLNNLESPSSLRRKTIVQNSTSNNQEEQVVTRSGSRPRALSAPSVRPFTDPSTNNKSQQSTGRPKTPRAASGRQSSTRKSVIVVEDISSEEEVGNKQQETDEEEEEEEEDDDNDDEEESDDSNEDRESVKEEQEHRTPVGPTRKKSRKPKIKKVKKVKKKSKIMTPEERQLQLREAEERATRLAAAFAATQERAKRIQMDLLKEKKQKEIEKEQEQKRIQEVMMKIEEIRRKKKKSTSTPSTPTSRSQSAPPTPNTPYSIEACGSNKPNTSRRRERTDSNASAFGPEEEDATDTPKEPHTSNRPYLENVEKYMRTRMQLEMEIRERTLRKKTELEKELAKKTKLKKKKDKENQQKKHTVDRLLGMKKALEQELEVILKEENEYRTERLQLEREAAEQRNQRLKAAEKELTQRIRVEEYKRLMEEEVERTKAAAEARAKAQLRLIQRIGSHSKLDSPQEATAPSTSHEVTPRSSIPTTKEYLRQKKLLSKTLPQNQNNQSEGGPTVVKQPQEISWSIPPMNKIELEHILLYEILSSCSEDEE